MPNYDINALLNLLKLHYLLDPKSTLEIAKEGIDKSFLTDLSDEAHNAVLVVTSKDKNDVTKILALLTTLHRLADIFNEADYDSIITYIREKCMKHMEEVD